MKQFTKKLKIESTQDLKAIHSKNNNKERSRTPEQSAQARRDKLNHYHKKWSEYNKQAETQAQKEKCKFVLECIDRKLNEKIK